MSKENLQFENADLGPESLSKVPSQNIYIGSPAQDKRLNPLELNIGDKVELRGSRLFIDDDNGYKIGVFYDFGGAREYYIVGAHRILSGHGGNLVISYFYIYECKKHLTSSNIHLALPEDIELLWKAGEKDRC